MSMISGHYAITRRALVELAIGDAIPEVLYEAVAEILRDAWEEARPRG